MLAGSLIILLQDIITGMIPSVVFPLIFQEEHHM